MQTIKTEWGHRAALIGVLWLAVFLRFFRLAQEGFANLYYTAGVQSMLTGWRPFFFAAFDSAGFVSIDKPPLGLWIQAAAAALLGFRGWVLLWPQAVAGVLSVALVYRLTRRMWGRHPSGAMAGLLAALSLAVTPISVATNRNNTQDSLLVCLLLLTTWALFKAAEAGRLRWLLLAFVLVGLGFNIKMLQAYMVLPAFGLLYLIAAPIHWWKRLLHLGWAVLLMGVVSLTWAVAVDLTPPDRRPFVGSSADNSVLQLMTGHNGLARLLPTGRPRNASAESAAPAAPNPSGNPQPGGAFSHETGDPGIGRLFNRQLAGQAMWLLPLAGWGAWVVLRRPEPQPRRAALFWLAWLLPQMVFFSFANLFHRYYLEMLAPALAVLVGSGGAAMFEHGRRRIVLPILALIGTAACQVLILWPFPAWRWGLSLSMGLLGGLAMIGMVQPAWLWGHKVAPWLGLLGLLIAPTVWAWIPVWYGGDGWLPFAGPDLAVERRVAPTQKANERLVALLQAQRRGETWLLATLNARDAAPIILATGQPVMALGGFSGSDAILTPPELTEMVRAGRVRFFLLPGGVGRPPEGAPPYSPAHWVVQQCHPLSAQQWGGPVGGPGMVLWDCRRQELSGVFPNKFGMPTSKWGNE